jgi:hypothetical protein
MVAGGASELSAMDIDGLQWTLVDIMVIFVIRQA